jgi:hypothetical protein
MCVSWNFPPARHARRLRPQARFAQRDAGTVECGAARRERDQAIGGRSGGAAAIAGTRSGGTAAGSRRKDGILGNTAGTAIITLHADKQ